MANRNDILNTLKTEMEDYIKSSRGYNLDPVSIKRGVYIFEDIEEKPAISFWCHRDEHEEDFSGTAHRFLWVYIFGFADTDGYESPDEIHELLHDIEYFLYNDFSLTNSVDVGEAIVYEGALSDPVLEFRLEIRIRYKRTTNAR